MSDALSTQSVNACRVTRQNDNVDNSDIENIWTRHFDGQNDNPSSLKLCIAYRTGDCQQGKKKERKKEWRDKNK